MPEAITHLGQSYEKGSTHYGLVKSKKKAAKILKRAVELGEVSAMVSLGRLIQNGGDGVKKDVKKGLRLLRAASDRGNANAQCMLGISLIPENPADAFRYLKLSAGQEHIQACRTLGICYEHGHGVERDLDEARRWNERAVAKGSTHDPRFLHTSAQEHFRSAREALDRLGVKDAT